MINGNKMVAKEEMIEKQLKQRDIHDPDVILAMWLIDRELFVPEEFRDKTYEDGPLPIGRNQTISQPYIVAYMAQALRIKQTDRILEVGSGCGYNAAVLSRLARQVYSVEIIEWLANLAKANIEKAEIMNVSVRHADGYQGWTEEAPFDKIMLTAAAPEIPEPLKQQLKRGGMLLGPVGVKFQELVLLEKTGDDTFTEQKLHPVRFVPMTGSAADDVK